MALRSGRVFLLCVYPEVLPDQPCENWGKQGHVDLEAREANPKADPEADLEVDLKALLYLL